jgi:hypothetical protein
MSCALSMRRGIGRPRKKLEELERTVDGGLICEGKISAAPAGEIRQAVAQLGNAVERLGGPPPR